MTFRSDIFDSVDDTILKFVFNLYHMNFNLTITAFISGEQFKLEEVIFSSIMNCNKMINVRAFMLLNCSLKAL